MCITWTTNMLSYGVYYGLGRCKIFGYHDLTSVRQHTLWVKALHKDNIHLSSMRYISIAVILKTYAYILWVTQINLVMTIHIMFQCNSFPVCSHKSVSIGTNNQSSKYFFNICLKLYLHLSLIYCVTTSYGVEYIVTVFFTFSVQ